MSNTLKDEPRLNTVTMSSQGQITLSRKTREQHELSAGETLIEISLPGCIILLPQSQVLNDLMSRAQDGLKELGLTPEQLKKNVEKRRAKRYTEKYSGVLDD